jgi:hypothetical protein
MRSSSARSILQRSHRQSQRIAVQRRATKRAAAVNGDSLQHAMPRHAGAAAGTHRSISRYIRSASSKRLKYAATSACCFSGSSSLRSRLTNWIPCARHRHQPERIGWAPTSATWGRSCTARRAQQGKTSRRAAERDWHRSLQHGRGAALRRSSGGHLVIGAMHEGFVRDVAVELLQRGLCEDAPQARVRVVLDEADHVVHPDLPRPCHTHVPCSVQLSTRYLGWEPLCTRSAVCHCGIYI